MIGVSVMAHPSRKHLVDRLLETLDGPAEVVWDRRNDEWDTGNRSWEEHDPATTHHLVLQDDALPCRDLLAGLGKAVAVYPDQVMSLYLGVNRNAQGNSLRHRNVTAAITDADKANASWITTNGTWWGPAILIPTPLIPHMLSFCRRHTDVYDRRIARWCRERQLLAWHPWPSWIEHADEPSLVIKGRQPGRTARRWVGAKASALDFDPEGPVIACKG